VPHHAIPFRSRSPTRRKRSQSPVERGSKRDGERGSEREKEREITREKEQERSESGAVKKDVDAPSSVELESKEKAKVTPKYVFLTTSHGHALRIPTNALRPSHRNAHCLILHP
jgi:hypothetical protein